MRPSRVLRMSYLAASVAGVGFFVLSVAWLGVWPARRLADEAARTGPEHVVALTASEARGRAIYAREGCAYCHTQQIRFTQPDIARFGAPTLAWETRADTPHMLGTRRIGPDLSRAGGTRSEDWQFMHLFAPRTVVPASVMPSYRHLFAGGPGAPRQDARDLVAYLETLGRARELAGVEGSVRAVTASHAHMSGLTPAADLNAHPARTRRSGDVPALPAGDRDRGIVLYARHCAACHGATREGDGPGASGLTPRPSNLAEHDYTDVRMAQVLWNGVAGTAMPAWRDLSRDDLGSLVRYLTDPRPPGPLRHDRVQPPAEMLALGKRVYDDNCAQCHGPDGAADGFAALSLAIAPTNFRQQRLWQGRMTADGVPRVLRDGIEGTMMASWQTRLTREEMAAVAEYVFQFFRDEAAARALERRQ
jgi:cytochrome c oxidase cbb3-type subunit 2/cytochrome c oxidase cbb3-type subunit I/II